SLGLPSRKSETYRYVSLRHVFAERTTSAAEEATPDADIVFIDGIFAPHLSQSDALLLSQAYRSYGSFLKNRLQKVLQDENDPFAALNCALHGEGAFLYLPPKKVYDKPIEILHIATGSSSIAMPRLQIFAGAESEATFRFKTRAKGAINGAVDLHLEPASNIKVTFETEGEADWHFESMRAALKRDARLEALHVTSGSKATRYDYRADLLESGASVALSGLADLDGTREAHSNVLIVHHAPNCTSNQLFKNIVNGNAHSSFEGKIYVHSEAQQTEAYQLNANLLLSEGARAESKPNLEIFADDVRASHGATFGKLEEDEIFYLQTRGLSRSDAEKALVQGFAQEILEKLR
ncbi:MAG: Fe-S cluster assembly protein SufD, partial [Chlamydiia bacterium]|nr:Fe-S cluster assembly protein SufD [Chlamydiia bacterium]